ncbi:MAG: hypothetical protein IPK67_19585 [Planctomycetes bacterium]|nr:hypothetical protein [Planctomycetota bacterium]
MLRVLKRIWRAWKSFAHALVKGPVLDPHGHRLVVAITPVALSFKLLFKPDPLDEAAADPKLPTYGRPVRARLQDIRSAQRPW